MPQTQLAPLVDFPESSKKSKASSAPSSSLPSSSTASLGDGTKPSKRGMLSAYLRHSNYTYTHTSDATPDAQAVAPHDSTATLVASPPKKLSLSEPATPTRRPSLDEVFGQMASKYGYGLPTDRYPK